MSSVFPLNYSFASIVIKSQQKYDINHHVWSLLTPHLRVRQIGASHPLLHQLATNRLSMSIVHYSILFPPRYIGTTQDLLRTSLLFRIHYPYTVHTVHTVLTRLLATHFPSKINIAKVVKNYDNVTSDNLLAVQQIFCWYSLSAYYTLLKNIQTALEVGQLGPPLC